MLGEHWIRRQDRPSRGPDLRRPGEDKVSKWWAWKQTWPWEIVRTETWSLEPASRWLQASLANQGGESRCQAAHNLTGDIHSFPV